MRILIAEDEVVLCGQIKKALVFEGHAVDTVHDGEEAGHLGATEPYDVIILDIGLPSKDGITILKEWRAASVDIPVLILTARDGWTERVDGLDAGADDYMSKPFHMPELSARLRALLRRRSGTGSPIFAKGPIEFDTRTRRVVVDGFPVELTSHECAVLAYLIHNVGRMVSRTELSEHIYEYDSERDSNTIAVFVTRLRKKLGADVIRTVRGRGYMIDTP